MNEKRNIQVIFKLTETDNKLFNLLAQINGNTKVALMRQWIATAAQERVNEYLASSDDAVTLEADEALLHILKQARAAELEEHYRDLAV